MLKFIKKKIKVDNQAKNSKLHVGSKHKIMVFDQGWICVGIYYEQGEFLCLRDASVIRKWGTEKGLGELAEKGPKLTPLETVLDPCGLVKAHKLSIVLVMDCNDENWRQ